MESGRFGFRIHGSGGFVKKVVMNIIMVGNEYHNGGRINRGGMPHANADNTAANFR
jgi:hypothetical protein